MRLVSPLPALVWLLPLAAAAAEPTAPLLLDNGTARIGLDPAKGAAITWL